MIRYLVDFALRNRMLVLAMGLLLLIWGIISFHNLPIEAYPDVADKYVWVITQWPGRAAEGVEQQVTIPIETQLNGVGHLTHLRSTSDRTPMWRRIMFGSSRSGRDARRKGWNNRSRFQSRHS